MEKMMRPALPTLPILQTTLALTALATLVTLIVFTAPVQAWSQPASPGAPEVSKQASLQGKERGESIVPEGSWVYPLIEKLYKQGMVSLPTARSPLESRKTVTRFQAAAFVLRALDRAHNQLQSEARTDSRGYRSPLAYDLPDVALMRRLVKEFSEELEIFGLKPAIAADALVQMEKAAASPEGRLPFPDVPSGHWAQASVERLRYEGILRGYPGGAFKSGAKKNKD
jgi:hypothetical protein